MHASGGDENRARLGRATTVFRVVWPPIAKAAWYLGWSARFGGASGLPPGVATDYPRSGVHLWKFCPTV